MNCLTTLPHMDGHASRPLVSLCKGCTVMHAPFGCAIREKCLCMQVLTTGDENTPAMMARAGPNNTPPPTNHRASLHSNALVTHPITDILDGTLWNRDLGNASEDIVGTLVAQLFTGIRDYIVQVPPGSQCAQYLTVLDSFHTYQKHRITAALPGSLQRSRNCCA